MSNPDDSMVLPEIISKEPLGPAVRQGDDQWESVVRWTHYAMLIAEEFGVTQANVDEMKKSENPEVQRLLGVGEGVDFGTPVGLNKDWAYNIIKGVGNYGESFERNVGEGSPLKIASPASTPCGRRVGCSTPRRSADRPGWEAPDQGASP
jgi:general L-amino acid-binding protein